MGKGLCVLLTVKCAGLEIASVENRNEIMAVNICRDIEIIYSTLCLEESMKKTC